MGCGQGARSPCFNTAAHPLPLLAGESGPHDDTLPRVAARHAVLQAQVAAGDRSARSLIVVPEALARGAKLTYPKDAFGGSQSW